MNSSILDEVISIGETGEYINGIGFKESDWDGSGLPIIRIQNLTNESKPFNFTSREVEKKFHVKDGDILVSWSATLDAFIWRRGPAILNQHIFKVVPRTERVDPRFLFYQLKQVIFSMSLGEHAHGSTMKHINRKPFLAHPFWCPRLEHQRKIGQNLDKLFSRIEDSERTLKRIQAKLKQARASILKAAVEGRLVETEAELARRTGRTFEPADQQLARINRKPGKKRPIPEGQQDALSQIEGHPSHPEGWALCKLGDIGRWTSGGTPSRRNPAFFGGSIPWVKTGELNDSVVTSFEETITIEGMRNSAAKLFPAGTLLVAMYGATIGMTGILGMDASTNQACAALLPSEANIESIRYLQLYLQSQRHQLRDAGQGGAQPNISQGILKDWSLRLPPINEQQRIIAEVDRRFSVLDQVESTVQASLARCVLLRQAILKRAFEGRLVPAPPEPHGPDDQFPTEPMMG